MMSLPIPSPSPPGKQVLLPSLSSKPKTAFISGHMEITPAQFSTHYVPHLNTALANSHHFVIGDAVGLDNMTLDYLLSISTTLDIQQRITIYISRPYNVSKYEEMGLSVVVPFAPEVKKDGNFKRDMVKRNSRERHLVRDALMTGDSDYDILWVRSEEEAKEVYGEKWRPRVSATELNRLRRAKLAEEVVEVVGEER